MRANELHQGHWYWCNEPDIKDWVQFIRLHPNPNYNDLAYVEYADIGWYVKVDSLTEEPPTN